MVSEYLKWYDSHLEHTPTEDLAKNELESAHRKIKHATEQLAKANEDYKTLFSAFQNCHDELVDANERVNELEQNQLPIENGKNRYGLDVSYFRNVINRELNRPLDNYKPDELSRVLARISRTADESVMFEPEFSNKFAIEKKIEALESFVLPYKQGVTKEYVKGGYGSLVLKAAQAEIEQLRKEQEW